MGPIGFKELVVILIVVLVVFGAKKLKTIGSDLGSSLCSFRIRAAKRPPPRSPAPRP